MSALWMAAWAPTPRTSCGTAGISTSAAPTACLLTSWPWWWTTPGWLGLKAPRFAHCPLLLAPDGRRLSKRDGDQSLENLRAKYTAEEIVGRLAYVYGLQPEPAPRTPESLVTDFSWENVPKEDICLPENLF